MLQSLKILKWKWESISMDFTMGLPKAQASHDTIWVIVDRLTKSAHFLSIKTTQPLEKLAQLYVQEIVRLDGIPSTIISDRDSRFTYRFQGVLQKAFGTRLYLSIAYHSRAYGQSERTIQTLEDMLRTCMLDNLGSWDKYLSLIDFAYNHSHHVSISMALYKALYGRKCQSLHCCCEPGEQSLL